ncbi:MAG: HAMP domain-containing sensor histidine kinase [Rhodothermia bacterium]|nr:MAG: HAMP domain-containing sensor histidine kinase [Rhodothermia bacterium]
MSLTLLFFVGLAVVAVGLYFTFILRNEIQVAFQQTMSEQVSRTAQTLEAAKSESDLLETIRDIARFSSLRVTVLDGSRLLLDVFDDEQIKDPSLETREELELSNPGETRFAKRNENGYRMYYAATQLRNSVLTVRVGQPEPPLFALIRRMQVTLGVAMIMALVLAVFGSWIAAKQITEPLVAISTSARSISDGDLDEEIEVDSRAAELQDLAESLNHMSSAFREKIVELERLAHLQNEFIGNVSHEVRNPIFSVGGYLEALSAGNLKADQRRFYAEKGLLNLGRLNNLFTDLIEIARLEFREDLIKPSVFNLNEIAGDVYELEIGKADDKGLELVFDSPSLEVVGDRARIRQVIINLVENAIAYSDKGIVHLTYRRHLDKVRIEVNDTGRGIPKEHLQKIFQRFHRVDPDRSRKSGGTGLGLSIVKQILHAHGENIRVESTLGRGTRFWFELPYAGEPPTEDRT